MLARTVTTALVGLAVVLSVASAFLLPSPHAPRGGQVDATEVVVDLATEITCITYVMAPEKWVGFANAMSISNGEAITGDLTTEPITGVLPQWQVFRVTKAAQRGGPVFNVSGGTGL
jgi:hypothetical protein